MKKIVGLSFVLISLTIAGLFIFFFLPISGNTPNDSANYNLQRLSENVNLFLSFSPNNKFNYYQTILGRRMSELKYVVEKKDLADIEKTSQRYETTVQVIIDYIRNNKLESNKSEFSSLLSKQIGEIKNLTNIFPYSSAEYRFVMNDYNSLTNAINTLSS